MAEVSEFELGTAILPPDEEGEEEIGFPFDSDVDAAEEPVVCVIVGGRETRLPAAYSRATLTAVQALRAGYALTPTPDLLTPNKAAEVLGVSRTMVIRWINDGQLEDQPVGTHHRIPRRSVHRLLESRRRAGRQALVDIDDPAHAGRVASADEQLDALRASAG